MKVQLWCQVGILAMDATQIKLTLRGWLFTDPNVMRSKMPRLPLLMFAADH